MPVLEHCWVTGANHRSCMQYRGRAGGVRSDAQILDQNEQTVANRALYSRQSYCPMLFPQAGGNELWCLGCTTIKASSRKSCDGQRRCQLIATCIEPE